MNNILSLIPCRILTSEDLLKLARELNPSVQGTSTSILDEVIAIELLKHFESLYALKLEKGHFVCEVEKPKPMPAMMGGTYNEKMKAYNEAQAKVIFEGFEKYEKNAVTKSNLAIWFSDKGAWMECNLMSSMDGSLDTIGDLLHSIARYNRTATSKIHLQFTQNVLKELGV